MDVKEFSRQLERSGQSPEEVRTFAQDFVLVRLEPTVEALRRLEQAKPPSRPPRQSLDWEEASELLESGVEHEWVHLLEDPAEKYLHPYFALTGEWPAVRSYLETSFLSEKQKRLLFPMLSKKRRPDRSCDDLIVAETRRLNRLIRWAEESALSARSFETYQSHIGIHGRSQNTSGQVGSIGATIAIMDAMSEIAPDQIVDVHGERLPAEVRTPLQVYRHLSSGGGSPRAMLLDNNRAIVFAQDPDVAIFQSLTTPYAAAEEAYKAWETVRRSIRDRAHKVHIFTVGEVKTATDPQNLHERLALGTRETRSETRTDRFLLMAILTNSLLTGGLARGRKGPGLANKDVERFSDVFNLYFAWGYDEARAQHPEHWAAFKRRLGEWCGLG